MRVNVGDLGNLRVNVGDPGNLRVNVGDLSNLRVKFSLVHTLKAYEGTEVWLHSFLTSALYGGEWLTSRPGRFTPGKYLLSGGWVSSRPVLGTSE